MGRLQVLITNKSFKIRGGAELYVRDVAVGLLNRGHLPVVYTTDPGEVSDEIRGLTVPIIDDLNALGAAPDIIHGQDHVQTMTSLLHFPQTPAVFFCHGWAAWEAAAPRFPRILSYVGVDNLCRDRLIYEHAIPEARVQVLLNFVDLKRFKPRSPLPERPQRALILSNYLSEETGVGQIREACARAGISLDVMGLRVGNTCAAPESILGGYDIVFAKGRTALEALAVGAAVILCSAGRAGPMVTSGNLDSLRPLNLGKRALREPLTADLIAREIAHYDPEDTAKVSQKIRETASLDDSIDAIVSLYRQVIEENRNTGEPNRRDEMRAAAAYLRWLDPTFKNVYAVENTASIALRDRDELRNQYEQARVIFQSKQAHLTQRLADLTQRLAEMEAQHQRVTNSLGWRLMSRYGPVKYKFVLPVYRRLGDLLKRGG